MIKKLSVTLVIVFLLVSFVLSGCSSGPAGVPQSQFDQVNAQLADAQAQLARAQTTITGLRGEKAAADSDLLEQTVKTADLEKQVANLQSKVDNLQSQVLGLQEQVTLTGATPTETAEKIVKYYQETHVYDTYDLFVCSDMAAEVWNMLKAQGISALIVVGKIDQSISDILQSDHSWVLAEVAPGDYLALETTGGRVVTRAENSLYYRGWTFSRPADMKNYQQLVVKYNEGVSFHNLMVHEDKDAVDLYNSSAIQAEADKWMALHDELDKLIKQIEADLVDIHDEIGSLATALN
jgi:outer membrane murein-binding lipoprotein Lpp